MKAMPLTTAEVGDALRSACKQRGMSQRAHAQHLGVTRARLGRLEADAGRQPLELVALVLARSGFQLKILPADPEDEDPRFTADGHG